MERRKDYLPLEETQTFQRFVSISNSVWKLAHGWKPFAQDTVGRQLVKALDSVGANMAEGDGRDSERDALKFLIYARGSAREASYWLARAIDRGLVDVQHGIALATDLRSAAKGLNGLIEYRRSCLSRDQVRETRNPYDARADGYSYAEYELSLQPDEVEDLGPNARCLTPDALEIPLPEGKQE